MSGEFEGKSLDALYAMIASAKPEDVTGAGEALAAAVPKILDIAADLRHYISRVKWEGEGAEAFRTWGAGMVSETLVLGDFTKVVSEEMKRAGSALTEAKAALPKPAGMCFADPEKEKARIEAETGPKLREAVSAMERLSSYYDATSTRIAAERQPEFKPMTPGDVFIGEREYGTGSGGSTGSGTNTGTGAGTATTDHASLRRADVTTPSGTVRQIQDPVSLPPTSPTRPPLPEVNTNLDSTTLVPDAPTRPPVQPPTVQPPTAPPVTTVGPPPVPLPPVTPPTGPQVGRGLPRTAMPGLPGPTGRAGLQTPGPLGSGPRTAEGIVGGRQVPSTRPGVGGMRPPRMSMGTVIGEEQRSSTPYGRGAAGMHGPGGGMHGPSGVSGGSSGRRLAMEQGGTVGTPSASRGVGRSAFTPGGTGLVRPSASTGQDHETERTSGHRPDYLSEDEETWTAGQRRIVPPVID
ncbi:hypothetical protein ACIRSU_13180 [Streptomyces sp. NPDC101160]|uniref:hypothetical protein n=1 Tax=Streptomyces sp. NPDC101160 TaxID=3366118 RepID=UPI00382CFC0D